MAAKDDLAAHKGEKATLWPAVVAAGTLIVCESL